MPREKLPIMALWPLVGYFIFLSLLFLFCSMGIIGPTYQLGLLCFSLSSLYRRKFCIGANPPFNSSFKSHRVYFVSQIWYLIQKTKKLIIWKFYTAIVIKWLANYVPCSYFAIFNLLGFFRFLGRSQTAITNAEAANFFTSLGQANILMKRIPAFFQRTGWSISKCPTGLYNEV